MTTRARSPICRLRHGLTTAVACSIAVFAGTAGASVILDPTLPGQYAAGTGANATFLSIDSDWKRTSVFWNEAQAKFSNSGGPGFERISSLSWGTGIWGLDDWQKINITGSVPIVNSWSGHVALIDQADSGYAGSGYAATWGPIGALPTGFFGTGEPQDNWTAHYTGYIRITDPGNYNFGVLYDDGFFLKIWGADGKPIQISSDFLSPRDRLGFDEDLLLSPGLYRFELGAYDRLQVGAVNLAWMQNGSRWTTVPTEYLVTDPIAVPTPGTAVLLVAGLGALAVARMKRKRG